jgi:DNA-binding CsgD family transcriptional regulator
MEKFTRLQQAGLTARECEVLNWVAHGKRDADIAKILGIAPKTVGKHIEHLLAKLHAENRTAAVSIARDMLH